jgi:hypothetical protein
MFSSRHITIKIQSPENNAAKFVTRDSAPGLRHPPRTSKSALVSCVTLRVHPSFVFNELARNLLGMVCRVNWRGIAEEFARSRSLRSHPIASASMQNCGAERSAGRRRSIRSESISRAAFAAATERVHFSSFPGVARPRFTLARKKSGSVKRRLWTFFGAPRKGAQVRKPDRLLTQRMGRSRCRAALESWRWRRKSLFLWFFGRSCWMSIGVFPTAARATYRLVMFPLKLEREVLLAESSEIQE